MDKQDITLVKQRVTVFCSGSLLFTPDLAAKAKELIPEKSVISSEVPGMPLQWGNPWALVWEVDGKQAKLAFQPERIDMECILEKTLDCVEINKFLSKAILYITLIQQEFQLGKFTRIAYAPMYALERPECMVAVWHRVLGAVCFKDGLPAEKAARYNVITETTLNSNKIKSNRMVTVSEGEHTITNDNAVTNAVPVCIIDLDINTLANQQYSFNEEDLKEYLSQSVVMADKMLDDILK